MFERLCQKNTAIRITVQVLSASDGITRISGAASAISALINAASPAGLLRRGGAQASETVTVTEQGSTGFYDLILTPTVGSGVGEPYLLVFREPSGIGAMERIEQYSIQVFDSITITPATGSYFTSLSALKEFGGWTSTGQDALFANLIARCTREIQTYLNREGVAASYTERKDGTGSPFLAVREWPITAVTSIHESLDQVFDSTTLVAAADYVADLTLPRIRNKWRGWFEWTQSIRVIYVGGWVTIPTDVEQACIELAAMKFEARNSLIVGSTQFGDGSKTIQREPSLTKKIGRAHV